MDFIEQHQMLIAQIKANSVKRARRNLRLKADAYLSQEGKCVFCKHMMYACSNTSPSRSQTATAEHVIPRCQGGGYTRENIVSSCTRCNNARRDIDYDAFMYVAESVEYEEIKKISDNLYHSGVKDLNKVVDFFYRGAYVSI